MGVAERGGLVALVLLGLVPSALGQGMVQLSCGGTLLEARGMAERQRPLERFRFSLALEAEAPLAAAALEQLGQRLALVRTRLQSLGVRELQVGSPSTWGRSGQGGRAAAVEASLQVTGVLEPGRLQALVLEVGALPGVRLAPVTAQANRVLDGAVRRQLLQDAYRDARNRATELAAVLGLSRIRPLEVQVEADGLRPMAMRAASAADVRFDPLELPPPRDSLSLQARFCAN